MIPAVDLDEDELFSQYKEVDPATPHDGLDLIMDVELLQELPKLQFGAVLGPDAFLLIFEELGKSRHLPS